MKPSQVAGKSCSPLYISTSWQNDQFAEAMAALMNQEKVKNAFVIAPNYQAGKDIKSVFDPAPFVREGVSVWRL